MVISPPGIAMPPAGLRFTDVASFLKMSPLSFDNGWTDRNAECCVNTVDEKILLQLVNFGPVTPDILRLICMGGE